MEQFVSKHNLPFEACPWESPFNFEGNLMRFRIGSCTGLWCSEDESYDIIAIDNSKKGNGHFEDVLQWFENSCKRDKKQFRILEIINHNFMIHLIEKRGFHRLDGNNVGKNFN